MSGFLGLMQMDDTTELKNLHNRNIISFPDYIFANEKNKNLFVSFILFME